MRNGREVNAVLIWIASYPRSGNTWFRVVLQAHCGHRSWSMYPTPAESAWTLGRIELAGTKADELAQSRNLHWVKTHERTVPDGNSAVYVVRDGRDALVSYTWYVLTHQRRLPEPIAPDLFRATMRDLIIGESPFGTWSENVLSWSRRPNTVVVRFEHLIRDPLSELRRVIAALGITEVRVQGDVAPPTFSALREQSPTRFRKGTIGQWRTDMPQDLLDLFWQRHSPAMDALGYG
jgi:hypothetical protein